MSEQKANPWRLTQNEATVMDLLTVTGSNKAVATQLDVTVKRVENLLHSIYKKMAAPNRCIAVLEFDRWARGQE